MPSRPARFSVPEVRRVLKVATETGLVVTGFRIEADGSISVSTLPPEASGADAALDAWSRGRGKG